MSLSRRRLLLGAAVLPLAGPARALDACVPYTPGTQAQVAPADALRLLREGNDRYLAGLTTRCDAQAQVRATAGGQAPIACVLGCIDSRVTPEAVFDQQLGSLFVARIAGAVVNPDILGGFEYACRVAGARAIVVLGHTGCGAVKGAIDRVELGNLTGLVARIEPAVLAARPARRDSHDAALVAQVAEISVAMAADAIVKQSQVLAQLVADRRLVVAGAMHDVATGAVRFL